MLPVGHIAENCTSEQRLCYNCRQPGHESAACPSPRTVAAKQCYSCGGVGHIQAECPSLRVQAGGGQKCYVRRCHYLSSTVHAQRIHSELRSFRPHCACLPQQRGLGWIRFPRTSPWTFPEYVHFAPGQVLSLRRPQPHGKVDFCAYDMHISVHLVCRDCLAAPGTTVADGAVGSHNKNKTCYKCQQEGHVSFQT